MNIEHALELQEHSWTLHAEGKLDDAAAACREALRLIEEAEAAAADESTSLDVANVLNELAQIEQDRQDLASALTIAERARTIERAGAGAGAGAEDDDRFADELAARIHLRTLALAGGIRRVQGDSLQAWGDLQLALTIAVKMFARCRRRRPRLATISDCSANRGDDSMKACNSTSARSTR
jgi:tetratricopeptide (TPR) repeat protein